ncbi:MAG: cobyrinate a,c-diamide synthase [Pseudomonadota bacterium]|nr:cobyrinate a,c-diamide synthase [Pseudomonadota bacterium]
MAGSAGAVIAAPSSGSGKTTVTLGLLRHFARTNVPVSSFKIGPDYIDPGFHTAAGGRYCLNLDGWAMRDDTLNALYAQVAAYSEIVLGEGVMGLFDGARGQTGDRDGSTADIARRLGLPVILVVDAGAQAQSAAATVHGFSTYREDTNLAGVIFNLIGSTRHADMLKDAMASSGIPVLGCIPRAADVSIPDRHLGLVQASEMAALETFLDRAADLVARHIDLPLLRQVMSPSNARRSGPHPQPIPPIGHQIAVAADEAFQFCYRHVIDGWRAADAEVLLFSPLSDQAPSADADAVYLPGGYPELHADLLSANQGFLSGLRDAAARGATVYGECGGYMVLGDALVDANGQRHLMTGLLPVETSFADRKLHLGYRDATLAADTPLGTTGDIFGAHEFHYARIVSQEIADPLFRVSDAAGTDLGPMGLRRNNVMGSFIHLIDRR